MLNFFIVSLFIPVCIQGDNKAAREATQIYQGVRRGADKVSYTESASI